MCDLGIADDLEVFDGQVAVAGCTVVDAGCGAGLFSRHLLSRGAPLWSRYLKTGAVPLFRALYARYWRYQDFDTSLRCAGGA